MQCEFEGAPSFRTLAALLVSRRQKEDSRYVTYAALSE